MSTNEAPNSGMADAKYYEYKSIHYDYDHIRQFPLICQGLERFLPLLPIERLRVSLNGGEGSTPVVPITRFGEAIGFRNLLVKGEDRNPTGCFKDRESAVIVSKALEDGHDLVYVASSGNAALSTAAYAQKAGISCVCYVPEKTSKGKQDLIKLFGAKLVLVPGYFEDVYRHVVDSKPEGWNVTTGQNEYRTEGIKTIAYELWEQVRVPDTIVVPCGNGACLAGIWQGYLDLKALGKIDRLPQMVAVQIKDAAPLKIALDAGKDFVILDHIEDSIAEGIVALESYSSPLAVSALRESGGYVIEVTDNEIVATMKALIRQEAIVPEPTAAAAFAAVKKLKNGPDDTIVVINTGSGMKTLSEIVHLLDHT